MFNVRRLVMIIVAVQVATVVLFGWLGSRSGIYDRSSETLHLGWSAAWRVGMIPLIFWLVTWIIVGGLQWATRDSDRD